MKEGKKKWSGIIALVLTGAMLFCSVLLLMPESKVFADEFTPEVATADEVNAVIDGTDTDTVLVDARPQEAFSGWALQGAKNGGHIKGAILYSARFLAVGAKASKITAYEKQIGLDKDKSYIIYDYAGFDDAAAKVAKYFYEKGVTNVKVFDAKDLIDDGAVLESYNNHEMYLPAEVVKDISDYKTGKDKDLDALTLDVFTEDEIKNKVLLFDVDYGNVVESDYIADGHVPGAVHVNTNAYERPRAYVPEKREKYSIEYSLIPLDEFRDDLCPQFGITKDSIVIAISRDGRPISRFGFMLKSLGVEFYGMTALMNAWNYNGYDVERLVVNRPEPVASFGSSDIPHPEEIVWMDEVKDILSGKEHGVIVGGNNYKTYSYNDLQGTIEGIKPDTLYYTNVDGTPASKEILEKCIEESPYTEEEKELIVPFCGDGWGASRDAYNAQAVGLDNVKYWGEGWVVWANRGNWFITKSGQKVRYNKYRDCLVDEQGNDVDDPEAMKAN